MSIPSLATATYHRWRDRGGRRFDTHGARRTHCRRSGIGVPGGDRAGALATPGAPARLLSVLSVLLPGDHLAAGANAGRLFPFPPLGSRVLPAADEASLPAVAGCPTQSLTPRPVPGSLAGGVSLYFDREDDRSGVACLSRKNGDRLK